MFDKSNKLKPFEDFSSINSADIPADLKKMLIENKMRWVVSDGDNFITVRFR